MALAGSVPVAAAALVGYTTLGVGIACNGHVRRWWDRFWGVPADQAYPPARTGDGVAVGARMASGLGAVGAVLGTLYAAFALGVPGWPIALAALGLAAPVGEGIYQGVMRSVRGRALPGAERRALPAGRTSLVGTAAACGDPVRAPLSGRACLAATVVAVDAHGASAGFVSTVGEVAVTIGEHTTIVLGTVVVSADTCTSELPARAVTGARSPELDELIARHPDSNLREYLLVEGDAVAVEGPPIRTEQHRAFNRDYRTAGEGPTLRGTSDAPVSIRRRSA